jgi:hypothetical protein
VLNNGLAHKLRVAALAVFRKALLEKLLSLTFILMRVLEIDDHIRPDFPEESGALGAPLGLKEVDRFERL